MDTTNGHLFFDGSCHGNMLFLGNSDPIFRVPRSLLNMAEETSKRRPFFSLTDELIDDDFYDEQSPEKKRRLTAEQVHLLEKSFEAENKLEPERKTQLAKKLGLQPRQVAVWFQNRRARWKTKQLERDYDLLKASYDSLLLDYKIVVHDNEKLKSEVLSLTEKFQVKEEVVSGITVTAGQQKSEPLLLATDDANIASNHFNIKVEDRLSTGSGRSAVLDDQDCLQLVDSGDSYFQNDDYGGCMGPIDGSFQSEGDDGSDDNHSYFSDVFAATTDQQHQETHQQLGWWVWS